MACSIPVVEEELPYPLWSPGLDLMVLGRIQVLEDLPCRGRLEVRQVQHAKLGKGGPGVQQFSIPHEPKGIHLWTSFSEGHLLITA